MAIGITSANPALLSSGAAGIGAGGGASPVVGVLSAQALGAIGDTLAGSLQGAAGPGGLVTGEITQVRPGISFTVTAPNQTEITLRWPVGAQPELGSKATLRIILDGPQPRASLIAIDGRPVVTRAGVPPENPPGPAPTVGTPPVPASGRQLPPARLSFADETALEAALAAPADDAEAASAQDLVRATLLRPAPARPGQTPLVAGTRYLVTLATDDEMPPTDSASLGSFGEDYLRQSALLTATLAGLDPTGQPLVETLLGVLALATTPLASADHRLKLRILAVAAPKTAPRQTTQPAPRGTLDDLLTELAADDPALAEAAHRMLTATPDAALLPFLALFLGDPEAARRALDSETKALIKRLLSSGRDGLAARLNAAARSVTTPPPPLPDGWRVITLPYPPNAGTMPVRLYLHRPKAPDADRGGADRDGLAAGQRGRGERVVIELGLATLGVLQFDGLARERRFDLALRSDRALPDTLRQAIGTAFDTAIESCGFAGTLSFGTIARTPFMAPAAGPGGGLTISA